VYVKSDFDYLSIGNNSRTLLLNSLFNKYSVEGDYKMEKDIVLADRENNIMTILDNGKITLQYFTGDNELVDSLLSLNRLRGANLNKQKEEYALIQSVV
jgi:ArsR family metal-binding transcriptional regulator